MEYITTQWNSLSESGKEIIILCGIVQVVVGVIMMNLLSEYDWRKKWKLSEEEEEEENREIG